jgi:hypothetical protein
MGNPEKDKLTVIYFFVTHINLKKWDFELRNIHIFDVTYTWENLLFRKRNLYLISSFIKLF